jgi:hypothetical protein
MRLAAALFVFVAAQPLVPVEYAALNAFLDGLGCGSTKCPRFLANESCTGTVLCSGGSVTSLDLSNRGLSGTLDGVSLGKLTGLRNLQLFRNPLRSTVPSELGLLTLMTDLRLYISSISGTLAAAIGSLTSLRALGLGAMEMVGTLPSTWAALTSLTGIDMNAHKFGGAALPSLVGSWTNLNHLAMNDAQLGGSLPSQVRLLTRLTLLEFARNGLVGVVPNLAALTVLNTLRLEENAFSGVAPDLPAGLSVSRCTLQVASAREKSCLVCPVPASNCTCLTRAECAVGSTLTLTAAAATTTTTTTTTVATAAATTTVAATTATTATPSTAAKPTFPSPTAPATVSASSTAVTSFTSDALSPSSSDSAFVSSAPESDATLYGAIFGTLALLVLVCVVVALVCVAKRRREESSLAISEAFQQPSFAPTNYDSAPGNSVRPPAVTIVPPDYGLIPEHVFTDAGAQTLLPSVVYSSFRPPLPPRSDVDVVYDMGGIQLPPPPPLISKSTYVSAPAGTFARGVELPYAPIPSHSKVALPMYVEAPSIANVAQIDRK